MAKLFPPLISNIIPAFFEENGIVNITIPFSMNRAVSKEQVIGLAVKIKTVQSSTYLYTESTTDVLKYDLEDSPWVSFPMDILNDGKLKVGQFYKFQIAYIDTTGEIGYYSDVATGKFTHKPDVAITNLKIGLLNSNQQEYYGTYINNDPAEKVYSYRFKLFNADGTLKEDSGDIIHNKQNNTDLFSSYDNYIPESVMEIDKIYTIQYIITTNNNLVFATPRYRITKKQSVDSEIKTDLWAKADFENGFIEVRLAGHKNQHGLEEPATGAFLLSRSSSDTDFTKWEEMSRFKLSAEFPSRWLGGDYTVEQGKTYQYSLQQYNDKGLYSNPIYSDKVYVDFEDAFLFDGYKQLKIKYNPKITNLKVDTLESKIDTIGGRHPFIFKNGIVHYKEFQISGLISRLMDSDNIFMDTKVDRTTQLTGENYSSEREFKTAVLEWLTDGNPKVFRSPAEGNFIVRLLNTSLTPNDTVGRMLHTFNTTAYEIADFNYKNLSNYDFISIKKPDTKTLRWETVDFYERKDGQIIYKHGRVNNHPAYTVRIINMRPGDIIKIKFQGREEESFQIGATGSYYIDNGVQIEQISIPNDLNSNGSMTYSYYSIFVNVFDKINNVDVYEIPARQFIGQHDILQEISYVKNEKGKWIQNPKLNITEFYEINITRRDIMNVQYYNGKYYSDKNKKEEVSEDSFDPFMLYAVGDWVITDVNNPRVSQWEFKTQYYFDPITKVKYKDYEPYAIINGSKISVEDTRDFNAKRMDGVKEIKLFNGAIAEVSCQVRKIDFSIEYNPIWDTNAARIEYENSINKLNAILDSDNQEVAVIDMARNEIDKAYSKYILTLIDDQIKEKEAEGLL